MLLLHLLVCWCLGCCVVWSVFIIMFLLSFVVFWVGVYICWCFGMRFFLNNLNIRFFADALMFCTGLSLLL